MGRKDFSFYARPMGKGREALHAVMIDDDDDPAMRRYLAKDSDQLPEPYVRKLLADLGSMAKPLPEGAAHRDAYACLHKAGAAKAAAQHAVVAAE